MAKQRYVAEYVIDAEKAISDDQGGQPDASITGDELASVVAAAKRKNALGDECYRVRLEEYEERMGVWSAIEYYDCFDLMPA